ncbi:hypothetical protein NP493_714g01011 [Ridgeia piscesae]|uniref:Non-specific serine/threonine protein kinase n=1 Tax=Ridgeia piscesae TaxID=27915 RepID=A0AAD9KS16_RIDPI|nr:hypothetical protein NP493_714g01011 [Ridgeia piscesae]
MIALFAAVEDGNTAGVEELLETATQYDINYANKHGETALHVAASVGHVDIVRYLWSKDIDIKATDKNGDDALYTAARQGHVDIVQFLKEQGAEINNQNKSGETALHVAARYGHTNIIEFLCTAGAQVNLQDKDEETPLHCAAARGNTDCVKALLSNRASINLLEKRKFTPLHLACKRRQVAVAMLLLHAGSDIDAQDNNGESPLHCASKEGLYSVVQTMCALGCKVDVVNKNGQTPLHQSARVGHTEVVRCLLLSGAQPEFPNKDGMSAEIMALAQGHNETAELLAKLKPEKRESCIKQLLPTNQPLSRIKLKLFGSNGVGKTTLIDSLKCGYFGSFFRKNRLSQSSSMNNNHIKEPESNGIARPRQNSLPTQLSVECPSDSYTRGVDVQQISVTGSGDLSVWEFSGYEPYYLVYDHFIGDPNCLHVVVFNLEDTQDRQLQHVLFWLNFIQARIAPMEPIGQGGRHPWPAKVVLVATHADKVECTKNAKGEFLNNDADILVANVKEKFVPYFDISERVFVMDTHLAMSPDMKALRSHLGDLKSQIVKNLPKTNGFLDATVAALPMWRKVTASYPVVSWPSFIEYVRRRVNLLTSEEHLKELMCQLQLIGEVIYIETESQKDLVVLNPKWLCSGVIGQLLSHDYMQRSRPTGCFSVDDFQLLFADCEASELLQVLEALDMCVRCENDGDVEYEFPCLNFIERLHGLWDRDERTMPNFLYAGMQMRCPRNMETQLLHVFPKLQVQLRRDVLREHSSSSDCDLYQWHHGSKFCSGALECLITLEDNGHVMELKCRGPAQERTALFYFLDDIRCIFEDVLEDSCPGISVLKSVMSSRDLREHHSSVHCYTMKDIMRMQLEGSTILQLKDGTCEDFFDLICFGCDNVQSLLTLGVDLHVSYLSIHARCKLSALLDPTDPMGRDWCLLAVSLGLTEDIPQFDHNKVPMMSTTDRVLEVWSRDPNATIGHLIDTLKKLHRQDAVDIVMTYGPLFHVFHETLSQESRPVAQPTSFTSENTLSSNPSR